MNIDERITAVGSMLAEVSVATPELERILSRRFRRRLATVIASATIIAIGGITMLACGSNKSPTAETWTYELPIDGATPLPTDTLTARTADAALWIDRVSGRYLYLVIRPGLADSYPAPVGLGPMARSESFPETQGQAWLTQSDESHVRTMTMWWTRTDGAVWILNAYWYGDGTVRLGEAQQKFETWALEISIVSSDDPQGTFRLGDASMTLFATDHRGEVGSRAQMWDFVRGTQNGQIILHTIYPSGAVGLNNLLARGMPTETILFGRTAWMVKDNAGQVTVGWQSGNAKQDWTILTIPASIASYTSEILSVLRIE
jgi:hypothetical protein